MPEKSAASQVRPNTPGGVGQAPIQSGQAAPGAPTPIQAVDQSHQGEQRPAVNPAAPQEPAPDSPAAALARDHEAEAQALAEPGAPSHCTVCGAELIASTELAQGSFDPDTGKQERGGQEMTGGGPGNVVVIQCPKGHESYHKLHGSWEREADNPAE